MEFLQQILSVSEKWSLTQWGGGLFCHVEQSVTVDKDRQTSTSEKVL